MGEVEEESGMENALRGAPNDKCPTGPRVAAGGGAERTLAWLAVIPDTGDVIAPYLDAELPIPTLPV